MAHLLLVLAIVPGFILADKAGAHVPEECRPLFVAAGKLTNGVVRKGNEANAVAMGGLDRGRRVGIHDYMTLADQLGQLLGWQGDMFKKLTAAIDCADGRQ